jgi:hypothetical protein
MVEPKLGEVAERLKSPLAGVTAGKSTSVDFAGVWLFTN